MALWFKNSNEFSKPWYLLEPDFMDVESKITFSECKFVKGDDGSITAFAWVTSITNLSSSCEIKDGGMPFKMTFHNSEYDHYDSKAKARVKRQATDSEKLMLQHFGDDFDWDAPYNGYIQLTSSEQLIAMYHNGVVNVASAPLMKLDTIDALDKLKDLSMEATQKKGGYSSTRGQSESDRLRDRWNFLITHLGELGTDLKTADELLMLKNASDPETMKRLGDDIKLIVDLLGD